MHNAACKILGIDDQFIFLPAEVAPKNLKLAIDGLKGLQIRGASVTIPHKMAVTALLHKVEEDAKAIGAVNTIVNRDGVLTGYNTDWKGAIDALEKRTNLKGKKAAVIGAGGAARGIVYGLIKKGAFVKIFNRSKDKGASLAAEFGCDFTSLDQTGEIAEMDIIINATPLGMTENVSPIEKQLLNSAQLVFDIVYSPKETKLIKYAKEKGAKIIYGYEMLLNQGIYQFKLFTGYDAPVEVMRKILEKHLR